MKNRLKELRTSLGLTQQEFADKIGTTRNAVGNYETGNRTPLDAVVKSICREFKVNELWLRNGIEPMFKASDDDFLEMSLVVEKNGDDFIKELTKMLWSLDVDDLKVVKKIVENIKNNPNL